MSAVNIISNHSKTSKKISNKIKENMVGYLFILPAMIFFVLFLFLPILMSLKISLYDYSGIGGMTDFVGMKNYKDAFIDESFILSIKNTFKLISLDLIFTLPISFSLAYMIYKRVPGWKFFNTALFVPYIVPMVVAALVWRFIYEPNFGLLNTLLNAIGLENFTKIWLANYDTAFPSVTLVWIWKAIPFALLVFYGGLLKIPKELFEAAKIDGANGRHIYFKIVMPLMMTYISMLAILTITNDFRAFDMIWVLTGGGPGNASTILPIKVFKEAFVVNHYGYANALGIIAVILVVIIITGGRCIANKLAKAD